MAGLDRRQGAETLPRSGLDVEQELSLQGHDLISDRLCSTRLVPPAMPPNPSDAGEQWRTRGLPASVQSS